MWNLDTESIQELLFGQGFGDGAPLGLGLGPSSHLGTSLLGTSLLGTFLLGTSLPLRKTSVLRQRVPEEGNESVTLTSKFLSLDPQQSLLFQISTLSTRAFEPR